MVTSRNAPEIIPQELKALETRVRLESLDVSDIRLIVYGDLALAGWHVLARTPQEDSVDRDVVACLIGNDERWTMVGMPWQHSHLLGL